MIKGNLTKDEALQKMQFGKKISHVYFDSDEYVYIAENGKITSEDGYDFEDWWNKEADEISEGIDKPWRVL